jgi:hypothetical protein
MKILSMGETNEKLVQTLQEKDPFSVGREGYNTEIADVIGAVHDEDNPAVLAKEIQRIYEFSFEVDPGGGVPENFL